MLTETSLKEQLRGIAENGYEVPDRIDPFQFALEMLAHLGSIDSELRDDLIFSTLSTWIDRDLFDSEQLRHFLSVLTDQDHLFNGNGEENTDSVFARSFSALLLQPIIAAHRRAPFLIEDELQETLTRVLSYLDSERDLRGYDREKGWAHSVAHTADVLDELAKCKELGQPDLFRILQSIAGKVGTGNGVYSFEEDERLVTAVASILDRGVLKESHVDEWIAGLVHITQTPEVLPETDYQFVNVKSFLRSLYFRILDREELEHICKTTRAALREISRF